MEQMLELAFSRRMCCSRACMVRTKARSPLSSVVSPTIRPGSLRIMAVVQVMKPR